MHTCLHACLPACLPGHMHVSCVDVSHVMLTGMFCYHVGLKRAYSGHMLFARYQRPASVPAAPVSAAPARMKPRPHVLCLSVHGDLRMHEEEQSAIEGINAALAKALSDFKASMKKPFFNDQDTYLRLVFSADIVHGPEHLWTHAENLCTIGDKLWVDAVKLCSTKSWITDDKFWSDGATNEKDGFCVELLHVDSTTPCLDDVLDGCQLVLNRRTQVLEQRQEALDRRRQVLDRHQQTLSQAASDKVWVDVLSDKRGVISSSTLFSDLSHRVVEFSRKVEGRNYIGTSKHIKSDFDAWIDGVQEVWSDGMAEVCNPQGNTMMVSRCGSQK